MAERSERLIKAVFTYPELYNVNSQDYRNYEKKLRAWESVSASVGFSAERCKSKWKNLRDRYIRERRLGKLKKKKTSHWRYMDTLKFLEPFARERRRSETSDVTEDPEDSISGVNVSTSEDKGPQVNLAFMAQLPATQQSHPVTPVAILTGLPPGSQMYQTSSPQNQASSWLPSSTTMSAGNDKVDGKAANPRDEPKMVDKPHDEDELFLLSLVPALRRLTPQKRCEAKIKIQQTVYEAEFIA